MNGRPPVLYVYRAVIPPTGAGYDGDTVSVWVDQGFGDWKHDASIRLEGGNATELHDPGGDVRKGFVHRLLPAGTQLLLSTKVGRDDLEVQSFARYVGVLWLRNEKLTTGPAFDVSVNDFLIWANVMVAWDGVSRPRPVPTGDITQEALKQLDALRPNP